MVADLSRIWNGITGDMCVHMLDTARWMLKLGWPTKITSTGVFMCKGREIKYIRYADRSF